MDDQLTNSLKASIKAAKATAAEMVLRVGEEKDPAKKEAMMKQLCALFSAAHDAVSRR
jgi:hypothetical protein